MRHSRARNVVERTFGLWKKKWGILRTQSFFDIKDQVTCVHWFFNKMHNIVKNSYVKRTLLQIRIINACCMLHNFARDRQHIMDDLLLHEVDNEISQPIEADDANSITSVQVTNAWTNFRNQLSNDMFAEYVVAHANLQQ